MDTTTGESDGRISVSHLSKTFGPVVAVNDLSFEVRPGRVTGFLGPNGAGKTTTLRMLLGLVTPSSGQATIGGRRYADIPQPTRVVGAALEAASFHPGRSARDHLRVLGFPAGVADSRVDELLTLVGLDTVTSRRVGGFSLGMRQRLALAATLLGDPQVLLLDEPANGLDPEGIAWLRGFLRLLAGQGRTVLVSSHVLSEVQQTVDDVVIIARGALVHASDLATLAALAGQEVRVRTPEPERLADVLRSNGHQIGQIEPSPPGTDPVTAKAREVGLVVVPGVDPSSVARAAAAAGVAVFELSHRELALEQVFLDLVASAEESSASRQSQGHLPPGGGGVVITAVRTELLKVRTTRLWWIMLGAMVLMVAALTALMAYVLHTTSSTDPAAGEPTLTGGFVYSMAVGFGYVFVLVMGTLSVTGEYRYQTMTPTLLAEPRRGVMVAGKTVGQFVTGLVFGVVSVLVAIVVGAGLLALVDYPTGLDEGAVQRALVLSPVALGLWAVVGVGVGAMIRNQIAAIVVIIAFNQFVDPILRLALDSAGAGGVSKFLPTSAGDAMAGGGLSSLLGGDSTTDLLPWWGGALVLLGYGVVFVVIGWLTTLRRDVS